MRDFAGGLEPAGKAKSVRKLAGGEVVVSDGPYLEAKEHVGGLWLLKCADMDEAVEWATQGRRRLQGAGRGARVPRHSGEMESPS